LFLILYKQLMQNHITMAAPVLTISLKTIP
jgi:hypothetical protein